MWLFQLRKKKPVEVQLDGGPPFTRQAMYQQAWQAKALPTPGAGNYAYETLSLYPLSPWGRGFEPRNHFRPLGTPGMVQAQTIRVSGIGTESGQIISYPLMNDPTRPDDPARRP